MKKTLLTAAVFVATLAPASTTFAYGGGPGFPPGYGGPVECHLKTLHLPFGGSMEIPVCRPGKHTGWENRWSDFIKRVVHGHNDHDSHNDHKNT